MEAHRRWGLAELLRRVLGVRVHKCRRVWAHRMHIRPVRHWAMMAVLGRGWMVIATHSRRVAWWLPEEHRVMVVMAVWIVVYGRWMVGMPWWHRLMGIVKLVHEVLMMPR